MGLQSMLGPEPETFYPNPAGPLLLAIHCSESSKDRHSKARDLAEWLAAVALRPTLSRQDCQGLGKPGGICGALLFLRACASFVSNLQRCGKKLRAMQTRNEDVPAGRGRLIQELLGPLYPL